MSRWLEGKAIVLGVSGGIACYKAADLVRQLRAGGARVQVVMTHHAREFVAPLTFQTLSGQPVATELFDLTEESQIGHIRLADGADAVVLAPATANLIAKAAHGLGDDLLTTVLLATRAAVLVAPAMNVHMWEHPLVQANVATLRELGWRVIEPTSGSLACGYEGPGRLAPVETIVAEVERALAPGDLHGERVLVTAGPNREPIDPVRFLSNRSTGRMGYALAAAAWRRGAEVVLVSGPTALAPPHGVRCESVTTAAEMRAVVLREAARATVVVMAAAVADYRPARVAEQKLKKQPGPLRLELERTADILGELARRPGDRLTIGFAAETERMAEHAERKLREKELDLIVANDVSGSDTGFAVDTNAVLLIDAGGRRELSLASKEVIADQILDRAVELQRLRRDAAPARRRRRR